LGKNDGKKEAKYKEDFENYFYDYNGIYEKILVPERFLLLGKKGTGKSILGEVIKKRAKQKSDWFCEISSYKEFNFHELKCLESNDIRPNEYILIWEWIILLQLAKLCLEDCSILDYSNNKGKLMEFIKSNYGSLELDMNKVIEITKKGNIKGGILKGPFQVSGEKHDEIKLKIGKYIDYIEDLRATVMSILKETSNKYTLIFDELDDKFRNEDIYKSTIISLIKIADKMNMNFYDSQIDAKIILLLRTDIFSILNDPDLNKVEQDNSVKIDWGNIVSSDSPLFKLIYTKIRKSVSELENIDDKELYNTLFPQDIMNRPPYEFILGRTFFRPRDIITYLNLIIEKYPQTTYFGWKGFKDLEQDYSKYFLKEIRNELSGHINDVEIDESILLLKQFKKSDFKYDELKQYFVSRKELYKNIDLEKTLSYLFNFSVIGNRWYNSRRGKYYHSWAYRENATIDFDKEFVVHMGLRKELSL